MPDILTNTLFMWFMFISGLALIIGVTFLIVVLISKP